MIILYVEDEPRSRKVMEMMAADMKVTGLVTFENSENFLTRAEAIDPRPDLIFLDIHVPPYDGFQMLKMLRGSSKFDKIPIVAMTASVMNEEIAQLRDAGFDGCIAKPIDIDTFPNIVDRILNGEVLWHILG